jgi:hypothetical protein
MDIALATKTKVGNKNRMSEWSNRGKGKPINKVQKIFNISTGIVSSVNANRIISKSRHS